MMHGSNMGIPPYLAYHIIGYMGASVDKVEFCPLIRLSRHNKAWELHTQGAKESLVATHSSNIGTHRAQLTKLLGGSLCNATKSLKGPL